VNPSFTLPIGAGAGGVDATGVGEGAGAVVAGALGVLVALPRLRQGRRVRRFPPGALSGRSTTTALAVGDADGDEGSADVSMFSTL